MPLPGPQFRLSNPNAGTVKSPPSGKESHFHRKDWFTFLHDAALLTMDEIQRKVDELVGFVSQLEMGSFYASQIGELLKAEPAAQFYVLPESNEDRHRREEQSRMRQVQYVQQVVASRVQVEQLAIELLRYQHWRASRGNS